jgi:hypothetical protein
LLGAQTPTHLEPVDARHEHVEDDGVGLVFLGAAEPCERVLAVLCEVDLVALELERTSERLAHCALVVDNENLHLGRIVRTRVRQEPAS